MIKLAICDDDLSVCHGIEEMVGQMGIDNLSTDVFGSGLELLNDVVTNKERYNIYLLDIEMPGISGIQTAADLRSQDRDALIIFATNHKEYVYEVFEVLPFRFVCKPVQAEALHTILQDAVKHILRENQFFFFHIGHEKRQIPYREILYFEGAGRKVRIHSTDGVFAYYGKISEVAGQLDQTLFAQIHGSYLLNMEYLRALRHDEAVLTQELILPVSRKYHSALRKNHAIFLKQRGGLK